MLHGTPERTRLLDKTDVIILLTCGQEGDAAVRAVQARSGGGHDA